MHYKSEMPTCDPLKRVNCANMKPVQFAQVSILYISCVSNNKRTTTFVSKCLNILSTQIESIRKVHMNDLAVL